MKRDEPVIEFDRMIPELEAVIRHYAGDNTGIKIMITECRGHKYRELKIVIQDNIEFDIQFR